MKPKRKIPFLPKCDSDVYFSKILLKMVFLWFIRLLHLHFLTRTNFFSIYSSDLFCIFSSIATFPFFVWGIEDHFRTNICFSYFLLRIFSRATKIFVENGVKVGTSLQSKPVWRHNSCPFVSHRIWRRLSLAHCPSFFYPRISSFLLEYSKILWDFFLSIFQIIGWKSE